MWIDYPDYNQKNTKQLEETVIASLRSEMNVK